MERSCKVSDLKVGERAKIVQIMPAGILKRRLQDMGFVRGEIVEVKKIAPLGSPIDVLIKGSHVSLRKEEEADKIIVEVCDDTASDG